MPRYAREAPLCRHDVEPCLSRPAKEGCVDMGTKGKRKRECSNRKAPGSEIYG